MFEFRHTSWQAREIYDILQRFSAALCIFEIAGVRSPVQLTADFAYVRLHGPTDKAYQGKYSESRLEKWADTIGKWADAGCGVYLYFDNDQAGYAAQNALELSELLMGAGGKKPDNQSREHN